MKKTLTKVVARGKEPSTWASIAMLFGFFGVQQDPNTVAAIGVGAASLLGIFLPENK